MYEKDTQVNSWVWRERNGNKYLESELLKDAGIQHAFFTKACYSNEPKDLKQTFKSSCSYHRTNQIHSSLIIEASEAKKDPWPEADGLISNKKNQSLWIYTSDCIPVLMGDNKGVNVAACHAGWKGICKNIIQKTVAKLTSKGVDRDSIVIALGPSIGKDNYQVREDVLDAINTSLLGKGIDWLIERNIAFRAQDSNRFFLDLKKVAKYQIISNGINRKRISSCKLCTYEEKGLFNSWRRQSIKRWQWSGILSSEKD